MAQDSHCMPTQKQEVLDQLQLQPYLQAVGLKVKIETYEWNAFLGVVNPGLEGKADMAEMAWMTNAQTHCHFLPLGRELGQIKVGSTQVIILILKLMSF